MSDPHELRVRLITALHNADCLCHDTPTHFAAQYTPQADAALTVFADWLREQINVEGSHYRASAELGRLAAAISHTRRDTPADLGHTGGTE